jgi:hypothetical protein
MDASKLDDPPNQYSIDCCDVQDKQRLGCYRVKRTEWLDLSSGDPEHAIWIQISRMLHNDAVFRAVRESQRLATEGRYRSASRNDDLISFITDSYFAAQTLAIRRLMDPEESKPERQVISLRRLLDDIKRNRELITREIYVSHDGLPYDPNPVKERFLESMPGRSTSGELPTIGPKAWRQAERAHSCFDKLSGVPPADRSRHDSIREAVFNTLDSVLKHSGWCHFVERSNKFVAHAADRYSRNSARFNVGFTLNEITNCHKALYQVANYIDSRLLWHATTYPPLDPSLNPFDQLDAPWLMKGDIEHLSKFWQTHSAAIEAWAADDIVGDANRELKAGQM